MGNCLWKLHLDKELNQLHHRDDVGDILILEDRDDFLVVKNGGNPKNQLVSIYVSVRH